MFISAAVAFPSPNEPAHRAAAQNQKTNQALIRDLAERAGATEPERLAKELTLLMEGAFVGVQLTDELSATNVAGDRAACIIDDALPAAAAQVPA